MDELTDFVDKLAPGVLWVVLVVVILFTAAAAMALSYHWREYAVDAHKSNLMFRGYLAVAGILTLIMIMAVLLY
jgi:hypothetical protein